MSTISGGKIIFVTKEYYIYYCLYAIYLKMRFFRNRLKDTRFFSQTRSAPLFCAMFSFPDNLISFIRFFLLGQIRNYNALKLFLYTNVILNPSFLHKKHFFKKVNIYDFKAHPRKVAKKPILSAFCRMRSEEKRIHGSPTRDTTSTMNNPKFAVFPRLNALHSFAKNIF